MPQQNLININPSMLAWARREAGFEIDHILKDLEIDHPTYLLWERFGNNVPFSKLKILAKIFQRQTAIFFLPLVPEKSGRAMDNRNFKEFDDKLSPEIILSIRRANRYCELLSDLNPEPHYQDLYGWINEFQETFYSPKRIDREEMTNWIRSKTGISIDEQISAQGHSQAYKMWRAAFEERLGIPVFQFTMPLHEIQGFSMNDRVPYCIALNGRHPITARIFTLFHQLGHLLKGQGGICYPEKTADNQIHEQECNAFAGMLMIPREIVTPLDSAEKIFTYANKLKVSSETYLRRLKGLNLINDKKFFDLLSAIEERVKPPAKAFGRATNIEKTVNSRGRHLFDSVIGAAGNNKISFGLASDILGVRINHLLKL